MKAVRVLLGILFVIAFTIFLIVAAVRFTIVNPDTWTTAFAEGDVYPQVEGLIRTFIASSISLNLPPDAPAAARAQLQALQAQFQQQLSAAITADKVQEIVEVNVVRFTNFLRGRSDQLLLYLPLNQLGLPIPIEGASEEAAVSSLIKDPEKAAQLEQRLQSLRGTVRFLTTLWISLGIISLILLWAFWKVGEPSKKMSGLAVLLIIGGVVTLLEVFIGRAVGAALAAGATTTLSLGTQQVPIEAGGVISSLVGRFIRPGLYGGLIALVVGIILLIVVKRKPTQAARLA